MSLRSSALDIFHAALQAADPRLAIERVFQRGDWAIARIASTGRTRIIVVGAGKAGAAMARAVEAQLGDAIGDGFVNVKYGHTAPTRKVKIHEAGHPLPDENGLRGTREIVELVRGLQQDDLVLCLISGGGSALLELPVEGVTLDDLRTLTDALLKCGATINEINAIRKHLSQVKGGQLARLAQPARVISLILSDVLGSALDVIASGPTAPDSTTFAQALAVIDKYRLRESTPRAILDHLERGVRGQVAETPKANDPLFARVENILLADNSTAARAAVERARELGFNTCLLSTFVEGEAREVAKVFAGMAKDIVRQSGAIPPPACLLASGETTVTIRGKGKGGRNQEFALAAALAIQGVDDVLILSAGTDGTDGPTEAAGAFADGTTVARAAERSLNAPEYLENNDSYEFFRTLGDLIITGPTNTNVNDLIVMLVGGSKAPSGLQPHFPIPLTRRERSEHDINSIRPDGLMKMPRPCLSACAE